MRLTLGSKTKIDILVAIFQLLKNSNTYVQLEFQSTYLHIQGMDKSHVCLFNIHINKSWFTSYEAEVATIVTVDSNSFHTILSRSQVNNTLVISVKDNQEYMNIDLLINNETDKNDYNRYFQLPVLDLEQDNLAVPEIEYDADFSLKTKQLYDLTSQLSLFGDTIEISCSEEGINLHSSAEHGKMTVNIPIDDLNEFTISEGETLQLSYSLNYIHKMCLTTKLSKDIDISLSNNFPIRLKYDIGDESYVLFYVAPKTND